MNKDNLINSIHKMKKECFNELRTKTVQKNISYWNGAFNILCEILEKLENGKFDE